MTDRNQLYLLSATGAGLNVLGSGLLQANPYLTNNWTNYASPFRGRSGFTDNLTNALISRGIDITFSNIKLDIPQNNKTATSIGKLGEDATANFFRNKGYIV